MIQRKVRPWLLAALRDTPVVLLHGPRQCGKTTLVRSIAENEHRARYLTLDDSTLLSAVTEDPQGFVESVEEPLVIDEVQRVPELFLAIKASVDRDRKPGRFLLTGSANVLLLPRLSETLAGRMEILQLWPLSQGELQGTREDFVDRIFDSENRFSTVEASEKKLSDRILAGGFPEAVSREQKGRRDKWFESYLTTLIQRDVRDLANIEGLTDLPRLLRLLASRVGSLQNFAEVSRATGFPQTTLKRYLSLLEASFLIQHIPAWSGNIGKRMVRSSKVFFTDTGILCHLLDADSQLFREDRKLFGRILENFVMTQLRKELSWSESRAKLFHFRSHSGEEVDFVLTDPRGALVGIEVKAAQSIKKNDLRGLRMMRETCGDKFLRGVILYTGSEVVPFGHDLVAVPIQNLWA
ncbi:MAG: ATP-binding protein [Candidatus Omnitrophica bacterium]|nr:ATP-binding protein [Candidatus Omnitrophota bacterium]MCB9768080.1 ATP-binding protein [Candidatus Omnitrophota bacterium]